MSTIEEIVTLATVGGDSSTERVSMDVRPILVANIDIKVPVTLPYQHCMKRYTFHTLWLANAFLFTAAKNYLQREEGCIQHYQ